MKIPPPQPLQDTGICLLAKERPDILFRILKDNYLPPPQMVLAIRSLKDHEDKKELLVNLRQLLRHWSTAVVEETLILLGIGGGNNGDITA